jgi:hypothetical protein
MEGAMGEADRTPRRFAKKARCAIYTRKSSEEGLEQAFAHVRSDHHAGRTWGKVGETPIVATGTGARFGFSLISAITSKGHMRFMITEGGVNAGVFIEFLKRLLSGATQKRYT